MARDDRLLAWIEQHNDDEYVGAFAGSGARERAPATQHCSTPNDAREWVNAQVDELGIPIEWVERP